MNDYRRIVDFNKLINGYYFKIDNSRFQGDKRLVGYSHVSPNI